MDSGHCMKCKKKVDIENGIRTRIRNVRTKNMHVDTIRGRCPHCKGIVYHIVGHA